MLIDRNIGGEGACDGGIWRGINRSLDRRMTGYEINDGRRRLGRQQDLIRVLIHRNEMFVGRAGNLNRNEAEVHQPAASITV